ncbi:MAG: hypothetical protein WAM72_23565, partial [Xanthobacteraceae bacterium]
MSNYQLESPKRVWSKGAEPSTQYRKFAEECRHFAQSAKTDEQRKLLLEMEAVWAKLAAEA